ncbi:MAG: Na+/H+ antiporter NhaC family protein [Muribaculaceae bacterium]|nr:Na+/H+ antiporter NhaC family protein [Muribaculaceae bacterium]
MQNNQSQTITFKKGFLAISPILVFMIFYLVVSLVIGDFYKMPLAVAFLVATVWAVVITDGSLQDRIKVFSKSAGSTNILYMIWIFILAGAFANLAKEIGSVDATVNLALKYMPAHFILPGLFVAACFISFSIGTSVGTVVALTPLAVDMATAGHSSVPLFIAAILGGAFFGDNLSFISDTTIAATRTQGCKMGDKFKTNIWIALPAAAITLAVYIARGAVVENVVVNDVPNLLLLLPYLSVIIMAIAGINVVIVLFGGIIATVIVAIITGSDIMSLFGFMGAGIDSMGNLIIVTLLASGLLGLIQFNGGIDYLLQVLTRGIRGPRGAQGAIGVLVMLVNFCTANNTVAIITVGSLSQQLSARFGVSSLKSASILDTCSCIAQCIIPYGAQTLLCTALAGVSPAEPWLYLYYPWALAVMVVLSIIFRFPRLKTSV